MSKSITFAGAEITARCLLLSLLSLGLRHLDGIFPASFVEEEGLPLTVELKKQEFLE